MHWRRDLGRTIDYIETRRDLDPRSVAFYGFSMGAGAGSVLLAIEERVRAAVLAAGGLELEPSPPEIDALNFLPHIRIPVLMINGRQDFQNPVETSQLPMFRLLGSPEEQKSTCCSRAATRFPSRKSCERSSTGSTGGRGRRLPLRPERDVPRYVLSSRKRPAQRFTLFGTFVPSHGGERVI